MEKTTDFSLIKYRRWNIPGHAHGLTFSCFLRKPLLEIESTKQILANSINRASIKQNFDVWAYVFMPEHIHLLIYPKLETYSISDILKAIKLSSSKTILNRIRINRPVLMREMETGLGSPEYRFWQDGGGYDRNYWSKGQILKQADYIHQNPVRRRLVNKATDYKWSSARYWELGVERIVKVRREFFLFNFY